MPSMPASTPEHPSFRGLLYRSLNPVHARQPLSGRGAALFGGRFNPRGMEALYTSLSPEGAIREANQIGALQPTTLVAYRADLAAIFDTRAPNALAPWSLTPADLADTGWRERMHRGAAVPTQDLAVALSSAGYAGMLVPSFARGAPPDEMNLVLWRWNTGDRDSLILIDDEKRLSRLPS
ncbi:RES domain-containing protein [Amorphus suaedae]